MEGFLFCFDLMCVDILPASMSVHHLHVWYLRPEKGVRSRGMSCELPRLW